jgi:aspartyl-tRNA(Asn)/glutamyl-tRNA(Gln) amidotransferase subunit B
MADFLEETVKLYSKPAVIANWLIGDITAYLNENKKSFDELDFSPAQLAELLQLMGNGTLSGKMAKEVLFAILKTGKQIKDVIADSGMTQISDEDELLKIVQEVIKSNPKQVEQFKAGKETVMMFLVGQVMKLSKGKANPEVATRLLKQELSA